MRLFFHCNAFLQFRGMQQPTPHLLRRKRRQARPLKPVIRQPQLRIRRVDPAVAGEWVGDEYAAGGDPLFGFFLKPFPEAATGQYRHYDGGLRVSAIVAGDALAGGQFAGAVPEFLEVQFVWGDALVGHGRLP